MVWKLLGQLDVDILSPGNDAQVPKKKRDGAPDLDMTGVEPWQEKVRLDSLGGRGARLLRPRR